MCTLTQALSSQCINLISPIYWNCLFVLLTGTISPGCGATGKLEVWLLILSCSSLFIVKLRWFRRCESQIRNKKSPFSPPFKPYICVFFPSCIQMEHTYFSLKHDTRVYCLKKQLAVNFFFLKDLWDFFADCYGSATHALHPGHPQHRLPSGFGICGAVRWQCWY